MQNDRLLKVTKIWNFADGKFGEKEFYFNPAIPIEGMEGCKVRKGNEELEGTKIFYSGYTKNEVYIPNRFIILSGTPGELIEKCKDANLAICLIYEIQREGISVKDFLKQLEGLNHNMI